MTSTLLVGTANVLCTLDRARAGAAVDGVLAHEPDLVALQEWGLLRHGVLRRRDSVRLLPDLLPGPLRGRRRPEGARKGYLWLAPLAGGCAVGARADRLVLVDAGLRLLSGPGRADPGTRDVPLRPARLAAVATYRDLETGAELTFVGYHLTPGVQARGRYRTDRPLLVGAHRHEHRALDRIVKEGLARGHVVVAAGDSNFDNFRLDGLTSAWDGRRDQPGTFGGRRIDDVLGSGPAVSVRLLESDSDHKAVLARVPMQ